MPTDNLADNYEGMRNKLRQTFDDGVTKPFAWRKKQLKSLRLAITNHYDELVTALHDDLGRGEVEASGEIETVLGEIDEQLAHCGQWMKPEQKNTHMLFTPGHTELRREPFGVVLLIGPFNYPVNLCLVPLAGVFGAGNNCVLKPSEQTPHTSSWMAKRLPEYVSSEALQVVEGGIPETSALLKLRWDFIFFTGSERVGSIVSRAAAEHCTPSVKKYFPSCNMELNDCSGDGAGGKAPVIIDRNCGSVREAAKRVAFGKFLNSGQTCMAPDYVLCDPALKDKFCSEIVKTISTFYGENPQKSSDYGRMCTTAHADRMIRLLKSCGGKVLCGGVEKSDPKNRYVAPTIVDTPSKDCDLLKEEIFGPILPVIPCGTTDDAIRFIRAVNPQPLCMYVFSSNSRTIDRLVGSIQSGDVLINDTFVHSTNNSVPFGGVGSSGHGTYKGRRSFDAFTYQRGVMVRHSAMDIDRLIDVPLRYPPSGFMRKAILPKAVRLSPSVPRIFYFRPKLVLAAAALSFAVYYVQGGDLSSLRAMVPFLN